MQRIQTEFLGLRSLLAAPLARQEGLAGVLLAPIYSVFPTMGRDFTSSPSPS
ncbi:hypothetical protein [Bosea sp. Tri-44]|uniref:hypothetical protein n=1 Tax=Bosea sp. Tri-44 TaxID=1972137 RepID=UPI0020BF993F|nr:hypothetical protein [Bosea sp. Tri-44]